MTDDEVRRTIEELERALTRDAIREVERGLAEDDPVFVQSIRNRYRAELATAITVFLLLTVGAVLLTVGVATASWPVWLGGVVAFLSSFMANSLYERTLPSGPRSS